MMIVPPTVPQTLGQSRARSVNLSPLVAFYRQRYPQFSTLTDSQFARAYGLSSVQTTDTELAAAGWRDTGGGNWEAPNPLCQALNSDTCPPDDATPAVNIPRLSSSPAAPTRPQQPVINRRTQPVKRRIKPQSASWSSWFWSFFGY